MTNQETSKMREITKIVVHCSATKSFDDIGAKEIRNWHKLRGWHDIGYHYVIRRSGEVEKGRPIEKPGAHVNGHNHNTIGICLVGGIGSNGQPQANYTKEQYKSLKGLGRELMAKNGIDSTGMVGHCDFEGVNKACPCIDVSLFFTEG